MQNVRATRESMEYWLMAVIVGFRCNVISCDLAWRGAAEASACGCCSTVGLTLILSRGQFFVFVARESACPSNIMFCRLRFLNKLSQTPIGGHSH